jgi:hypothetical protein
MRDIEKTRSNSNSTDNLNKKGCIPIFEMKGYVGRSYRPDRRRGFGGLPYQNLLEVMPFLQRDLPYRHISD